MAIASPVAARTLEQLTFARGFLALPASFYELRQPEGLPDARLIATSADAAALIELAPSEFARPEFTALASGNALISGMQPFAARYGGHQFGYWAGQLGDGRAITLAEITTARGEPWEFQLKGAGMTAFSRFADGRAVLRSTIREMLASEFMAALGIPTTRALAMTASSEPVRRETIESAAMVIRLAPSFVRFGSFEMPAADGDAAGLRALLDYTIDRFFPEFAHAPDRDTRFFAEVVARTARLMAAWQSVGFAHGVMNTDNFSILGLTLDYGPYGFLERYEPGYICNHTDEGGRYAFDQQPGIGAWNCAALGHALAGVMDSATVQSVLAGYPDIYRAAFLERMAAKLGLERSEPADRELVSDLMARMEGARSDFTRTFRALSSAAPENAFLELGGNDAVAGWIERYRARLALEPRSDNDRIAAMRAVNPRIVLRNHLAQEAIAASEQGDDEPVRALLRALQNPFSDDDAVAAFDRLADPSAAPIVVSCSS